MRVFVSRTLLVAIVAMILLPNLGKQKANPRTGDTIFALRAPSFVSVAHGASRGPSPLEGAGISAYVQSPAPINLDDVRDLFRTIQEETKEYLIGTVALGDDDYDESSDVHVYVNTDGLMLAYYLADDPAAKIVDLYNYDGASIEPTKLASTLMAVAAEVGSPYPGATYYDFRHPDATHMVIVAENMSNGDSTFLLNLQSAYTYYERSWALSNDCRVGCSARPVMTIDGTAINSGCVYCYGFIPAAQLTLNLPHVIEITDDSAVSRGAVVVTYRSP